MPTYSSPGNYVIENDFSEYAPAVNSSIAGIVGFASKGPSNKATLITSASQLLKTFGATNDVAGGQGLLAALEILSKTNSVYYVRAENGTLAADASVGINFGSCPAITASGIPAVSSISFAFSSTDEAGTSNTPDGDGYILTVASTGADPAGAVLTAHSAIETNDWPWTCVSGTDSAMVYFVNNHAGKDANLTVSSNLRQGIRAVNASSGDNPAAGGFHVTASGTTALAEFSGGSYFVESLHTGAGYNASTVTTVNGVTNKGLKIEVKSFTGKTFSLNVINNGVTSEGYQLNMTKDGTITLFPEDVINIGETNPVSQSIKASFKSNTTKVGKGWTPATTWDGKLTTGVSATQADNTIATGLVTPRFMKLIDGTYSLAGGNNGDSAGGSITSDVKAALIGTTTLKSGIHALDDDSLNISMACVPGITQMDVQNTLITLAESSQNFLAVVAPPEGLPTAAAAVNWHNGNYTGRSAAITSSYAAVYWPWLKQFDTATSTDIFLDPAAYAISMMCYTDSVSDPWFAPAGLVRGRLSKPTDIEVILNQGDRDSLYQPGNAINPIAKFAQDGIVIWGQRTAQRTPSSLDRINVRRMMIVIRKMLLASTRSIIFEPNDPMTWNRVVQLVQPAMDDIRRRRGITQFRVICDDTTNTPLRVDRNELWCRVLIKPTKTAEVLVFELNLTNQSAQLGV